MKRNWRLGIFALIGLVVLAVTGLPAGATHDSGVQHSQNLKLTGNSPRPAPFTQSDLAFKGRYAYAGNYSGFRIVDISDPRNPVQVGNVNCNGLQGDVSIYGKLLFLSVDRPQTSPDCTSQNTFSDPSRTPYPTDAGWEGIRIFDVGGDPASVGPGDLVAAAKTQCGSHTNTLVPDEVDPNLVHIYVSSYPIGSSNLTEDCQPPHGIISVVHVPLNNPAGYTVTEHALDPNTLPRSGTSAVGCHDISVFLAPNLAAGSCLGEGQYWDISDRSDPDLSNPVHVRNNKVEFWHNAAFTWDGDVAAFGDEAGGGVQARCTSGDSETEGAVWFYNVLRPDGSDRQVLSESRSSFKMPRPQTADENCTAHNFNFLTRRGSDFLVSAWYQGGTSIVDVTNRRRPTEIAYWDPAPLVAAHPHDASARGSFGPVPMHDPGEHPEEGAIVVGGQWSTYWYNGNVYANDITRGLNGFVLGGMAKAQPRRLSYMNPQTQETLIP